LFKEIPQKYKHITETAKEEFLSLLNQKVEQRAKVLLVGGMILYPLWTINDYIFSPEWYWEFLVLRLIVAIPIIVSYYLAGKGKIDYYKPLTYLIFVAAAEVAFMCSVVSPEAQIPFFLGYTTIYVVVLFIIIAPPKFTLAYYLYGVICFLLAVIIFGKHSFVTYFKNGAALYLTVSSFAWILSVFNYNSVLREIEARVLLDESHRELERKNKEIIDSITYARRIQNTILPPIEEFSKKFREYFLLYLPKDIVAGDFYWLETYKGKIYFAVADCTGHGVPGAMVSVVCSSALTRALTEENCITPGEILDKTKEIVVQKFSKSKENVRDGMDVSICCLDRENHLLYSGANNPLWIYRRNKGVIEEILPDKQPVGNYPVRKSFETKSVEFQKDDIAYLFSDGFQDQFGGEKGKKLKAARLKKYLEEIAIEPLQVQREKLQSFFEEWKGNYEQIDDVCILGIKL
jgi:serine phosphatase RsbU (regulator of sigma subunit)